nr:photosystem I subunit VIII [Phacus arnoldii]WCH63560.1 photosystem I subunit VIII [Phacus arnoldii]
MSASFLPSLLVPIIGFLVPLLSIWSFLFFVGKDDIN